MATGTDSGDAKTGTVVVTRAFAMSRDRVYAAWTSAEHVRHWFGPVGFTVPEVEIDFRVGGAFNLCMRSPAGEDHWMYGTYLEIDEPARLVFRFDVGPRGRPAFTALTTVTFDDEGRGTRVTVTQAYDIHEAHARGAIQGAAEGWRMTLDKLQAHLAR